MTLCGIGAGAIGAAVGNPADLAMVRMQADGRLPVELETELSKRRRTLFSGRRGQRSRCGEDVDRR